MALWNRLWGAKRNEDAADIIGSKGVPQNNTPLRYAFVDAEVGEKSHQVHDIGALRSDGAIFHRASKTELLILFVGITLCTTMLNISLPRERLNGGIW